MDEAPILQGDMAEDMTIHLFTDLAQARRKVLAQRGIELELPPSVRAGIRRVFGEDLTADQVAARILADVRQRGDEAVLEYTWRIDDAKLEGLAVEEAEVEAALDSIPLKLRQALELAVERVRGFHQRQPRLSWMDWREDGGALGQIVRPLERVGIYAPGGRAPYPSSLIMAAVPARVARVKEILVATPPREDGAVTPVILAAAQAAGVDRVFKIGGAQAIGAFAYGTESVPQVDKIVGPGNVFIIAAKRQVFGEVGIDQLPGPTETMLIADEGASPAWVAADLLAQAEHDPLASAILLTPSLELAQGVREEIEEQMESLSRREIIAQSLAAQGGIIVVQDLDQAVELANEYAPEHLCLLTRNPWALVGRIENAGGIFVGEHSSEALGDYVVGPSHIMPTGGTARFSSPLNVWDFVKITSIFAPSVEDSQQLAEAGIAIAEEEGLTAHAEAIRRRVTSDE
ncbi:MAG: histidinol dehydrogenase [Chloroflexota bacterium]|nr:histidinol dehydrogenase [Chloroflexota bacterium]